MEEDDCKSSIPGCCRFVIIVGVASDGLARTPAMVEGGAERHGARVTDVLGGSELRAGLVRGLLAEPAGLPIGSDRRAQLSSPAPVWGSVDFLSLVHATGGLLETSVGAIVDADTKEVVECWVAYAI
ncbi:hypothetical protein [Thiocapsa sp.]|uniref:hypothetical protein n=1 Tax=Thiocapsa sp. TaxID=2024551 RepID=UPI0025D3C475|nr:hypothetical protein [Thiocapsa sp.]